MEKRDHQGNEKNFRKVLKLSFTSQVPRSGKAGMFGQKALCIWQSLCPVLFRGFISCVLEQSLLTTPPVLKWPQTQINLLLCWPQSVSISSMLIRILCKPRTIGALETETLQSVNQGNVWLNYGCGTVSEQHLPHGSRSQEGCNLKVFKYQLQVNRGGQIFLWFCELTPIPTCTRIRV